MLQPKTENFLISKFEEDEHNVSSEENLRKSNWKSDGEGSTAMESSAMCNATSRVYNERSGLHGAAGAPLQTLKGTGNLHELEAAASSPCRVIWSGPQVQLASDAGRDLRPRRRQLVSESVPRTCLSAGVLRLG